MAAAEIRVELNVLCGLIQDAKLGAQLLEGRAPADRGGELLVLAPQSAGEDAAGDQRQAVEWTHTPFDVGVDGARGLVGAEGGGAPIAVDIDEAPRVDGAEAGGDACGEPESAEILV